MRRSLTLGVGLVLLLAAVGCDDHYDKHEAVTKGMLATLNDLADALESVKDKASAKAAAAKINTICDRLEDLGHQADALPKLTKSEEEKLEQKYTPEVRKARARFQSTGAQAARNCEREPDFLRAVKKLETVAKSLERLGK
jgi:hypothetical protein